MTHIAVILGSTRPGRRGEQVAHWVMDRARQRKDAAFDLIARSGRSTRCSARSSPGATPSRRSGES